MKALENQTTPQHDAPGPSPAVDDMESLEITSPLVEGQSAATGGLEVRQAVAAPVGRVTLVMTDLQGSTQLWEQAFAAMREALSLHNRILRDLMAKHSGYEVSSEGDAFLVAFGDPCQAVRFCLAAQVALFQADWPLELSANPSAMPDSGFRGLRVRMGVHTGSPEIHHNPVTDRLEYQGPVTNRTARITSAANGGQILLSEIVWRAVRDPLARELSYQVLGERRLRDLERPERLVQVLPLALSHRRLPAPNAPALRRRPDETGLKPEAGVVGLVPRWTPQQLDRFKELLVLVSCLMTILVEMAVIMRYSPGVRSWVDGFEQTRFEIHDVDAPKRHEERFLFSSNVLGPAEEAFMSSDEAKKAHRNGLK